MKFFVSITILLILSIDLCLSQAIHQPRTIQNGALYHQEIFYGGSNNQPSVIQHNQNIQFQNQPIFRSQAPLVQPIIVTTTTTTSSPKTEEFINTPTTTKTTTDATTTTEFINTPRLLAGKFPSTTSRPTTSTESLTSEEIEEQAKSAYYNFGTSVHDTINDHEHVRQEVRDGLKLKGMYSYSDGFFKRTVHYEADQGGYRVVKEDVQPITGEGPKFNPKGQAEVKNSLAGDYSITIDDFKLNKQQEQILKDGNGGL